MHRPHVIAVLAAACVVSLAPTPARAQTEIKRGRNFFSKSQDIEIGQESAKEAEKEFPVLKDDEVQRYVAELGAKLAAQAPGYKFPYSFKVVDVADINAFALPGGPTYINRGTIEAARTEGELAGVMAHEISHVDLRHGTRQASKAVVGQLGLAVLGSVVGSGETTKSIIDKLGGFGMNTLFLKYSRAAETEADVLGSQIMTRAGYDPSEMASFFELLAQQSKHRTAEFFSSHPAPERRKERIEQEDALLHANPPAVSQARFKAMQERLRKMPPAKTMEQLAKEQKGGAGSAQTLPAQPGTVEAPSRRLVWYENKAGLFKVAHPDNWQVLSEGQSTVTIAAKGGAWRTSGGGADITHGIMIAPYDVKGNGPSYSDGRTSRLDSSTDEFLGVLRKDGPYLQVVTGTRRRVTVDGADGMVVTLAGVSPSTQRRERVTVVTTEIANADLLTLLYVVPDNAPREYDDLFSAVLKNLRVSRR